MKRIRSLQGLAAYKKENDEPQMKLRRTQSTHDLAPKKSHPKSATKVDNRRKNKKSTYDSAISTKQSKPKSFYFIHSTKTLLKLKENDSGSEESMMMESEEMTSPSPHQKEITEKKQIQQAFVEQTKLEHKEPTSIQQELTTLSGDEKFLNNITNSSRIKTTHFEEVMGKQNQDDRMSYEISSLNDENKNDRKNQSHSKINLNNNNLNEKTINHKVGNIEKETKNNVDTLQHDSKFNKNNKNNENNQKQLKQTSTSIPTQSPSLNTNLSYLARKPQLPLPTPVPYLYYQKSTRITKVSLKNAHFANVHENCHGKHQARPSLSSALPIPTVPKLMFPPQQCSSTGFDNADKPQYNLDQIVKHSFSNHSNNSSVSSMTSVDKKRLSEALPPPQKSPHNYSTKHNNHNKMASNNISHNNKPINQNCNFHHNDNRHIPSDNEEITSYDENDIEAEKSHQKKKKKKKKKIKF